MKSVTQNELDSLYNTMQSVRKEDGSYDWHDFTTPKNRKIISRLSREELLDFKSAMRKVDLGMTHSFVREAYAMNPNEDEKFLWDGMSDEDMNVPLFIVQNNNCPAKLLEAVAENDQDSLGGEVMLDYIREKHPEILVEARRHREALKSGDFYSPTYIEPLYSLPHVG